MGTGLRLGGAVGRLWPVGRAIAEQRYRGDNRWVTSSRHCKEPGRWGQREEKGIFEVRLGRLAGADPEVRGHVGAYLTRSALKARPCHIHPQLPAGSW